MIGFNEYIAWGMTNCGWDVTDLYQEKFDSPDHNKYLYQGKWLPVKKIPQTIKVKNAADTTIVLQYTHRGPIMTSMEETFSIQWTGYDDSFVGAAIYGLNRAKNYNDYLRALKDFNSPAQNIIYADVEGNIAITSAGKNPIRKNGFGRFISDGRKNDNEWISFTPFNDLPQSLNPKQAYLASANQQPLNSLRPYFGWKWYGHYRARRINELLKSFNRIEVDDVKKFQTDSYAVRAEVFVPFILNSVVSYSDFKGNTEIDSILYYLRTWNFEMKKEEVGATIFSEFMGNYKRNTWKDNFPSDNNYYLLPDESVLERLTKTKPNSKWFDNLKTAEIENRDDIIRQSLLQTSKKLTKELGSQINQWRWERYHKTKIPHLSELEPLSIAPFSNNGGTGTLNVGAGKVNSFGPYWRMIVSLERPVRALGVYPGGQSGNPGSSHYCDFLETYENESYFELLFPKSKNDIERNKIESQLIFTSEEN